MSDAVTQLELTRTANEARDPAVIFEHVSIAFKGVQVLEDVSFAVQPGETRILLGPAGVGKSTLLKLANGLLRPDEGRIYLFGRELTDLTEEELLTLRVRTGMVFQEGALFDSLSVRDNVGYQLMERLLPEAEISQRVHEALKFVELDHTFDMLPASLSGGMRRRVAIARAIIDRPDMLFYDSPTGGLDPVTSTTIIELVVKQRDVYRTPSLLVTHRLQDAFTLCSHRYDDNEGKMVPMPHGALDERTSFLVLHAGKLIFDGTTAELVRSEDPFLKEFLA